MIYFKGKHHDELSNFSSVPIQNEVLTFTYEHPSSIDHLERQFQANISPYEKILEQPE